MKLCHDPDRISLAIWDNDGCLQKYRQDKGYGDPEDQYYAGFEAIARTFRKHLDPEGELRRKVMGIDIRDVGEAMIEELKLPITYSEWKCALDAILLSLAQFAEIAEGGAETIGALMNQGVSSGVASSSVSQILNRKWERFEELKRKLKCFVAGDDERVRRSKPEPDLLLVAAEDAGFSPEECMYIGDSGSDMKAAKAAGMLAVALPSGGRSREYYVDAGADYVLDSPLDVLRLV